MTGATCPGVRAGIHEGEFDVGLLLESEERGDSTGTSARAITGLPASDRVVVANDLPLVIFGGPLHPLVHHRERALVRRDELAAYPLFMSDAAGDFHVLVRHFFESDDLPGPHLEVAGSVEGVKRGVATDSQALGILPAYAVVEELQDKRLAALSVRPKPPSMRLEALLSLVRPRHPAAAELLEFLGP